MTNDRVYRVFCLALAACWSEQPREYFVLVDVLLARIQYMPAHTHTHTHAYSGEGRDLPDLPLPAPGVTSWTFCDDNTAGGSEAICN